MEVLRETWWTGAGGEAVTLAEFLIVLEVIRILFLHVRS